MTRIGPAGLLVATCLFLPQAVQAHPFSAEPPAFDNDACVVVVDKREQERWHLDYRVPVEDTVYDPDLIQLPDNKTHQFMAVQGYIRPDGMGHVYLPFGESAPRPMPTWLTREDVQRADEAVDTTLVEWGADMLTDADVVESDAALWMSVLPFDGEPRRVPITQEQGMQGMDWELAEVPPGIYQIVAHTFSPPYNSWTPRPGLLKVVDGSSDPVVATLRPVGASLFAGQGRRISGCVDAPEGSTVELAVRDRGEAEGTFETWIEDQPVVDGEFDVCLQNPGTDGALEVRVQVRTPEGEVASVYAEEVVAMFATSAPCLKSETRCCPPVMGEQDGKGAGEAGMARDAGGDRDSDSGNAGDSGVRERDAGAQPSSPDVARDAAPTGEDEARAGCRAGGAGTALHALGAALLAGLLLVWRGRAPFKRD